MPEMIVDTSAFIAFFVRSEKHHESARQYVLDEYDAMAQVTRPDS